MRIGATLVLSVILPRLGLVGPDWGLAVLPLGCPGWLMAVMAIYIAPLAVTCTVYRSLGRASTQMPQ